MQDLGQPTIFHHGNLILANFAYFSGSEDQLRTRPF